MPVITVDGPTLTKEQKAQLVQQLTQIASDVIELPTSAFTVLINERDRDNVGVSGELLSQRLNK